MEKTFHTHLDNHDIIHQTNCVNIATQNDIFEQKISIL